MGDSEEMGRRALREQHDALSHMRVHHLEKARRHMEYANALKRTIDHLAAEMEEPNE